jgi:uncharacterized protein (TIGR00369 family)
LIKGLSMPALTLPKLISGYRANIAAAITTMPAFRLLGLEVIGFGKGVSVIALPVRPEITFDGQVVQGGIVGVLADFAAVCAAIAAAPPETRGSTTSFDVHNLAPATGTKLVGIGRAIKVGRTTAVAAADVYAIASKDIEAEATLVATAIATCRLVSPSF